MSVSNMAVLLMLMSLVVIGYLSSKYMYVLRDQKLHSYYWHILFVMFSDFLRIKMLAVYYTRECKTLIRDHVNT
jgi:hypothetical protein